MVKTYILNTEFLDNKELFNSKLESVDKERKEKILRLPFANQKLSLGAGLLIKEFVGEISSYNKHGKPISANGEFNVSHSGKYVVLSKSKKPVGVDIEILQRGKNKIAHRFFTIDECIQIDRSYDRDNTFTRIWTLKEAFLKCIGTGIGEYFSKFTIFLDEEEVKISQNIQSNPVYFKEYFVECYKLAVCSEDNSFSREIEDVTQKVFAKI